MKTTAQILKDAKQLLVTKGWTKGSYAQNAVGIGVMPYNPSAACFCGHGAVAHAAGNFHPDAQNALSRLVPTGHFPTFNDHPDTELADVLALFDIAIELEETK